VASQPAAEEVVDAISVESIPSSDQTAPSPAPAPAAVRHSENPELTEARLLLGQAVEALASMQRVMGEMERRLTSLEARASTQPVKPGPPPPSFDPGWADGPLMRAVSMLTRWLGRLVRGVVPATRRLEAARAERKDR
jgi:hypothetical protein